MSDLTPELAAEITAACQTNAEEIAGALGRAFEGEFQLEVGETAPFDTAPSWAGLVVAMKFGEAGMLALLPDVDGVVPQWAHEPDPTGEAKLSTLSQELSMLLVPETLMSEEYRAAWADDLSAAVQRAEALEGAMIQPMEFTRGDTHGVITLVWPVRDALAALGAPAPTGAAEEQVEQTAEPAEQKPQSRVIRTSWPQPRDLRDLPPNTVSALQVAVP